MSENLPTFKYHPDPIGSGVFVESTCECPVCGMQRDYMYVGPFYSNDEVEGICPSCIANGKAAEKFDLTFVDEDEIEEVDDESLVEELTKRTPGYFFAQEDSWPVHCGDFCVVMGSASSVDIQDKVHVLQADLDLIRDRLELTDEVLNAELARENSPLWTALFKCEACGTYRLVADYE
ncbi:CbrC family protein [Agarivorans sp. DSG3-1]|uniref:CbrC family protein n=1 Tax=Agarivorans sp. DSG3-1 TaxID=3342249 RepID=UPI00398EDA3C